MKLKVHFDRNPFEIVFEIIIKPENSYKYESSLPSCRYIYRRKREKEKERKRIFIKNCYVTVDKLVVLYVTFFFFVIYNYIDYRV